MCWIHNWSKWSRPMDSYTNHKVQWRECKDCGKAQHRQLGYDQQCITRVINERLESVNPLAMEK